MLPPARMQKMPVTLWLHILFSFLLAWLCRKVKYLNMKGSLVDEHTVRALSKAGKEVSFLSSIEGHIQSCPQPAKEFRIILQNR